MAKRTRMHEASKLLIDHIRKHGTQTTYQLEAISSESSAKLTKRLNNLATAGWLEKIEHPHTRPNWAIRSTAADLFDKGMAAPRHPKAPPPMGDVAAPRRIDVMHGIYQPALVTPARMGSQAFRAIASHGLRC